MPDDIPQVVSGDDPTLLASLNEDACRQLAQSVAGDYRRWKHSRSRLEARWRECWEAYLCDTKALYTEPDADMADRSRVVRPVLYEAVEAIHANLLNALFPASERFFTVLGKTEADQQNARLIEEFLRTKLEDVTFIEKYALFLKQAVITGNSVAAVPWKRMRQTRRVEQPVTLFGVTIGYQKVAQEELVYNGPDIEVVDIFDFLVDPDATEFAQAKVIRKVERSLRELKANPAYGNLDVLQASRTSALADADDANKQSRRRAFGLDEPSLYGTELSGDKIRLLEAWGDFVVNETVYRNYVCVVADDKTVIRFEPNPYDSGLKPFIFTSFIPVPNEIYGIGAIEKSLGLQHAINTLTNQKLDVINLSINNPFTYLINDDVFDPDTLVTRPGALIPVKSHDTLRPIHYPNNFTVAFSEIADLKTEAQEATGALKYFTGADSVSTHRTATEVSALVSGGSQKFSSFLSHLEHTSLEPFLRIVYENSRQFVTEAECLRMAGADGKPQFQRMLPEILKGSDCCFRIDGTRGLLFKEQELQAISTFLRLVENHPQMKGRINLMALYRKIYRRLGFTDEAEIFVEASPSLPEDVSNGPASSGGRQ
jgi:hypothetical protein